MKGDLLIGVVAKLEERCMFEEEVWFRSDGLFGEGSVGRAGGGGGDGGSSKVEGGCVIGEEGEVSGGDGLLEVLGVKGLTIFFCS